MGLTRDKPLKGDGSGSVRLRGGARGYDKSGLSAENLYRPHDHAGTADDGNIWGSDFKSGVATAATLAEKRQTKDQEKYQVDFIFHFRFPAFCWRGLAGMLASNFRAPINPLIIVHFLCGIPLLFL